MPVRLSSWLWLIDTTQFGLPKIGAAYLLHGDRCALVDTGTPRASDLVKDELGSTTPEVILLTHIHLDHAGGAPALADAYPQATVYVHERGVRHLVNPTRLNESVRAATGPLADLYGEMKALSPERIHPLQDRDRIELGQGLVVEAINTPGHAPHHLCEKLDPPYLSGYPSLRLYQKLLTKLHSIGVTSQQILKLTLENIYSTFSL